MTTQHARSVVVQVVVEPPAGPVIGTTDGTVCVWRGIPYARSPVGPLRFRPPAPVEPWADPFMASKFGAAPVQPVIRARPEFEEIIGGGGSATRSGEDCLRLNVWAPAAPGPHPVLVWLHGGGQNYGSTSDPLHDGTAFARNGVVVVTIGYRLGVLGSLELGGLLGEGWVGTGDNMLRDQLLGLCWVNANIAAFGGDPACTTLAGNSSGAKNVVALTSCPHAVGLFRAAAVQSGGGHTTWTLDEADAVTRAYLVHLGLDPADGIRLLRAPASALVSAQRRLLASYPVRFPFRAVIDGDLLPGPPLDHLSSAVALLAGSNEHEHDLYAALDERGLTSRQAAHLAADRLTIADRRYAERFPGLDEAERHSRLLTTEEYGIPAVRLAEAHIAQGGQAWLYRFAWTPDSSRIPIRAAHGLEVPFVLDSFANAFAEALVGESTGRAEMTRLMHGAWAAFVRTQNPQTNELPTWPPYDLSSRPTMVLGLPPHLDFDPDGDERRLWDDLL